MCVVRNCQSQRLIPDRIDRNERAKTSVRLRKGFGFRHDICSVRAVPMHFNRQFLPVRLDCQRYRHCRENHQCRGQQCNQLFQFSLVIHVHLHPSGFFAMRRAYFTAIPQGCQSNCPCLKELSPPPSNEKTCFTLLNERAVFPVP